MALDFPNTPTVGSTFTSGGTSWVWDGTKWVQGPQTPSLVTVSVTAPSSPTPGTLWYDLNGGLLYCYVNDGNSSQWVVANPNSSGIMGPAGATGPQGLTGPQGPYAFNYLHNPYFNIQQRGAGPFTASNTYTADRWIAYIQGSDTYSASLVALADSDRTAIGDEAAIYAISNTFTGSTATNSGSLLYQKVENVRRLSNKTVTVSFWARATSATPRIGVGWYQSYGTGGSPSAYPYGNFGVTPALSTTWQRYALTGALPSTTGKTFGTTVGTDLTQIEFWLSDQGGASGRSGGIGVQSGTVQFWGMQLEVGPTATPLAKIEPGADLANCQRFYVVQGGYLYGLVIGASDISVLWTFPVPMRTAPNITLLTTTPYCEQPPYSGAHSGSGSTIPNNHNNNNTAVDVHINGFSSLTNATVCSLGAQSLAASADL